LYTNASGMVHVGQHPTKSRSQFAVTHIFHSID